MKNKILLFMPILFLGGAERQFRYFIEYCNKKNIPLVVVVENEDENAHNFMCENRNVKFYQLNFKFIKSYYKRSILNKIYKLFVFISAVSKIKKIISKEGNIEYCISYSGLALKNLFWIKEGGIKCFFSERNSGETTYNKKSNRFNAKIADGIYSNSIPSSKFLSEKLKRDVPVIYNGVKIPERVEYKTRENKFIILVSARVARIKNVFAVVKAVNLLEFKDNVEVCFCGKKEDELYYSEIEAYIKENKLEGIVHFEGFVNNVEDYYKKADLVILPSLSEGMPNAILEGFINKRMVISSDIEMNSLIMQDDRFTFPAEDINKMAEKIEHVYSMSEEEKINRIEDRFNYVKDNFSVDKMAENVLDFMGYEY